MAESNYLINSKCNNCGKSVLSLHHIYRCPFCHSTKVEHSFKQTFTVDNVKEERKFLERILKNS